MPSRKEVIDKTKEYIKNKLGKGEAGHDWWHAFRVWQNAKYIAKKEGGDLFVIELAALLHDIADWKFNLGDDNIGPKLAREWLKKMQVDEKIISHVYEIIKEMSFKGSKVKTQMCTEEGMIVQDADRLDAIGAIGIARGFMFAGNKNLLMHNPLIKPLGNIDNYETYKNLKRPTYTQINHFYEKLLLLKNLMNTKTGKRLARGRHEFLKKYLKQFFKEWNIK